ncbi:MAG: hypothetical protein IJ641_08935 [Lachnospiraceae bacterium]|nr:hypothetical protein [Lachnospiraceae bacterium]
MAQSPAKNNKSVNKSMEFVAKKRRSIVTFSFVICLIAVAAIGGYYQVMKHQKMQSEVKTPTTELEKLIAKDLEIGYPETPTEVMKLWGRINQCIYNTSMSDEEFSDLFHQLRAMYSSDLLDANPEEKHLEKFKAEVEQFQSDKKKVVSYNAETGASVRYKTINDRECAYITISYFMNTGGRAYAKSYQDFILVKQNDRWKVFGFKEGSEEPATKGEVTGEG